MPTPPASNARNRARKKYYGWRLAVLGLVLCALVSVIGANWAIYNVLPYAIVGTDRSERWRVYHGVTPVSLGLNADRFRCEVEPGIRLDGWFLHAEGAPRGTIFFLHGHNSCKESMLRLGKLFVQEGYNALLYDSRGHGESGGRFCTYGFYEREDCSRCLNQLIAIYGEAAGPVGIYGNSFGGAVALQAMAVDPRFRCGVIESTFANLREIVQDYAQHLSGVRLDAITNAALSRAGQLANFSPGSVSPENAARQIQRPVLLIHGTADWDISFHYGERIFRNLAAPGSEWFPVEGANHGNLWRVGGEKYRKRMIDFVARWDH